MYLLLKQGFVKFLLFLSFRIDSIAQDENTETPEIFEPLKTLNCFVNLSETLPPYARTMILTV